MNSVSKIALNIVAGDNGKNPLDEYYRFYNDGKWVVEVARKLSSVLSSMKEKVTNYSSYIPKFEECLGYISDAGLDEMGTDSCAKELRKNVADIKKKYSEWLKAPDDAKSAMADEYFMLIAGVKDYVVAFEKSCMNVFRNRYVEDEANVRNLLEVVHNAGNYVINEKKQQNEKND